MRNDTGPVGRGQLLAVFFIALMSPTIRLFPRTIIELAGSAAWLSPIAALAAAPGLLWLLKKLHGKCEAAGGLGALLLRCLGGAAGRAVLAVFALWHLFYAGFVLRAGADRFVVMVYPASGPAVFIFTVLALSLLAALHDFRALARSAVLFRAVFLAVLVLLFAAALPDLHPKNLLPVSWKDTPNILLGATQIFNPLFFLVNFLFLRQPIAEDRGFYRSYLFWISMLLIISAMLCVTAIGSFGAELSIRFNYPFFVMVRNLSLLDIFDRIEALIITLWVFSDFIMVSLMLFIADADLRLLFKLDAPTGAGLLPLRGGRWLTWLAAAAAGVIAMLLTENTLQFHGAVARFVANSSAALIVGLLPLCLLIGKLRKKL